MQIAAMSKMLALLSSGHIERSQPKGLNQKQSLKLSAEPQPVNVQ